MRRGPEAVGAWTALDAAAAREAPDMNEQAVANAAYAYAVLGMVPGEVTPSRD